jgi:arylformamidase
MTLDSTLSPERSTARARDTGGGQPERALYERSIIDISIELDASTYRMRSYEGFTKDMQFEIEVIKDYPGGLGQIVRGAHMRLHAGTHIDAPSHMVRGGDDIHDLPLDMFIGPAVVADVRHRVPKGGITADDMDKSIGDRIRRGDRVLLRTDINDARFDGSEEWMASAPYLSDGVIGWFRDHGVTIVGFDFYHAAKAPGADAGSCTSRQLHELGILTLPALKNLGAISKARVTLIALPLKMINVEASPVRAIVIED